MSEDGTPTWPMKPRWPARRSCAFVNVTPSVKSQQEMISLEEGEPAGEGEEYTHKRAFSGAPDERPALVMVVSVNVVDRDCIIMMLERTAVELEDRVRLRWKSNVARRAKKVLRPRGVLRAFRL